MGLAESLYWPLELIGRESGLPEPLEILERHPPEIPGGKLPKSVLPHNLLEGAVDRLGGGARVEHLARLPDEIKVEVERSSPDHSRIRIIDRKDRSARLPLN